MSVTLPAKPSMDNYNMNDDKSMMEYQEASQRYNRILTMLTQMQTEEASTKANMDKAKHDAVMAIVKNLV